MYHRVRNIIDQSASKTDINLTSNLINRRIDVFFWVYFTTEFIRNWAVLIKWMTVVV